MNESMSLLSAPEIQGTCAPIQEEAAPPEAVEGYASWSKGELYARARELDIPGRSLFTKQQLARAIQRHEEQQAEVAALEPVAWLTSNLLRSVPLYEGRSVTLGRSRACDVTLPQKSISRVHAELWVEDGVVSLRDRGSQNGVHLNGKQVKAARLEVGDMLTMGAYDLVLSEDGREDLESTSPLERTRRGLIAQEPLQEILQDLDLNKRSAVLTVLSGDLRGRLVVVRGAPLTAHLGDLRDGAAVLAMLSLREGRFLLSKRVEEVERTMVVALTGLLLQHFCGQDEARHEAG